MDDAGARAVGISLWLVPEGEVAAVLTRLIEDLAAELGTPTFPPHVTLLGGLRGREGDVLRKAREMAAALEPLTLPLGPVTGRDDHFRGLFVRIPETLKLLTTHAQARITYRIANEAPFEPHLSLAYGRFSVAERERLALATAPRIAPRMSCSALEVMHTQGAVADWRRIARLEMG